MYLIASQLPHVSTLLYEIKGCSRLKVGRLMGEEEVLKGKEGLKLLIVGE